MIDTFSQVYHLRQSRSADSETISYPHVPAVINPFNGKRASSSAVTSGARQAAKNDETNQLVEGYTGELGVSREPSQSGDDASETSAPLRWIDLWPEL